MAKTRNPKLAKPKNFNRFRGVTSALTQSSVPDELTTTQHNLESREIRQTSTRRGTRQVSEDVWVDTYYLETHAETYDGTVHQVLIGHEIEALAEGSRVWASQLFPFASGPASNLPLTPGFPTFLPPDFPVNDWDYPTIDLPDVPDFDWPGVPPFEPQGPFPDPPPYPGPDAPPDAPYGPNEPPGFGPEPDTPCGWTVENIQRKFSVKVSVDAWRMHIKTDNPQSIDPCISGFCEPSALNCANFAEAKIAAGDWGLNFITLAKQSPSWFVGGFEQKEAIHNGGPLCTDLDFTLESETVTNRRTDKIASAILCLPAEFPTGTILVPNRVLVEDYKETYTVNVDITIQNFKPLALATNMCKAPSLALEWENGYRKDIPMDGNASMSLDGDDLTVENFELGELNSLKSNVGYPTYTPCDLVTGFDGFVTGHMVCEVPALIWDCGGAPPPPLKYV